MSEESSQASADAPQRLASLDALRGFDMFWIIGGSGLVLALGNVLELPSLWMKVLSEQLSHV